MQLNDNKDKNPGSLIPKKDNTNNKDETLIHGHDILGDSNNNNSKQKTNSLDPNAPTNPKEEIEQKLSKEKLQNNQSLEESKSNNQKNNTAQNPTQISTNNQTRPSTPTNQDNSSYNTSNNRSTKILIIAALIFFILIISLFSAAVAVAYGKIDIKNQNIEDVLHQLIVGIPFMPKTPKYVITQTVLAHKDISSAYIEASMASDSRNEIANLLGNNLDLSLTGPIDLNDKDNPKFSFNLKLSRELDIDLTMLDQVAYFKINRLPTLINTILPLNDDVKNKILNTWVSYDVSKLKTEARDVLEEENPDTDEKIDEAYENTVYKIFNEDVLPITKLSNEEVEGVETHKLNLLLNKEQIQDIQREFLKDSDTPYRNQENLNTNYYPFERIEIDMWVNKDTFLLNKYQMKFTANLDYNNLNESFSSTKVLGESTSIFGDVLATESEMLDAVLVLKLDEVGEVQVINKPPENLTKDFEEWSREVMQTFFGGSFLDPERMKGKARDSQRMNDLNTLKQAIDRALIDGAISLQGTPQNIAIGSSTIHGTDFTNGWVKVTTISNGGLSNYIGTIPDDPKKEGPLCNGYQWASDGTNYEIRTCMESESYASYAEEDEGDDSSYYEIGTDKNLL